MECWGRHPDCNGSKMRRDSSYADICWVRKESKIFTKWHRLEIGRVSFIVAGLGILFKAMMKAVFQGLGYWLVEMQWLNKLEMRGE